jgi:hypothetical protein
MRDTVFLLLVWAAVSVAQWTDPVYVTGDSGRSQVTEADFICGLGDTLWAFHIREFGTNESMIVRVQPCAGDSWLEPVDICTLNYWLGCLNPAVDPQGRLWASWYHGSYPTDSKPWEWTIRMTWRDSAGWREEFDAVRPEFMAMKQDFASGREGNWYLVSGVDQYQADFPFHSVVFIRWLGDTWSTPRVIAQGHVEPDLQHRNPTLVTHPDSGAWSVHDHRYRYDSTHYRIVVNHVLPDTAYEILRFPGFGHDACADSAGRLWVIYVRDSVLRAACIVDGVVVEDRAIADDLFYYYFTAYKVCTDPDGWVWAAWTSADTTTLASYNRGHGWSEPETVATAPYAVQGLLSDSDGTVHVLLCEFDWSQYLRVYSVLRICRPGVAEGGEVGPSWLKSEDRRTSQTIVRGILVLSEAVGGERSAAGARLLDVTGRRVMDLQPGDNDIRHVAPGVYFLRSAGSGERSAVRKVVVQR